MKKEGHFLPSLASITDYFNLVYVQFEIILSHLAGRLESLSEGKCPPILLDVEQFVQHEVYRTSALSLHDMRDMWFLHLVFPYIIGREYNYLDLTFSLGF